MKAAVTILCSLLIGIAAPVLAQAGPAENGKALVESEKCAICHKAGGMGQPMESLAGTKDDAFLKQAILDPKKAIGPKVRMPAYKLTDEEVQGVIAYLRSIAKK